MFTFQSLKNSKELPKLFSVVLDQGLMSLTTLFTTVVLARVFSKEIYAEVVLLFAITIFFHGFQSALISKPYAINLNDFTKGHSRAYFNFNLKLKLMFTLGMVLLFPLFYYFSFEGWDTKRFFLFLFYIVGHSTYFFVREALLSQRKTIQNLKYGLFCCLSLMVLLTYMYFGNIKQLAFFLITAPIIYLSAAFIYILTNYKRTLLDTFGFKHYWNSNWLVGKWLVGSNVLFHISSNIYPWLLLYITSDEDIAVFGVLMSVAGLVNPILTALSSYLLPVFVKMNDNYLKVNNRVHKWLLLFITLAFILVITGYFFGQDIITLLFGSKYTSLGLLTVYPFLVQAIIVIFQPFKIALNAIKRTDINFYVLLPRSVLTVILGYWFVKSYGLLGVFYTMMIENFCYQLFYYLWYRKIIKSRGV